MRRVALYSAGRISDALSHRAQSLGLPRIAGWLRRRRVTFFATLGLSERD